VRIEVRRVARVFRSPTRLTWFRVQRKKKTNKNKNRVLMSVRYVLPPSCMFTTVSTTYPFEVRPNRWPCGESPDKCNRFGWKNKIINKTPIRWSADGSELWRWRSRGERKLLNRTKRPGETWTAETWRNRSRLVFRDTSLRGLRRCGNRVVHERPTAGKTDAPYTQRVNRLRELCRHVLRDAGSKRERGEKNYQSFL
jgi:hypothetical protein